MAGEIYCLYHADCSDGVGAAWAVWKKFPNTKFYAVEYSATCPMLDQFTKDDIVIIVDFSYEYAVMDTIRRKCGRLIFLDHHHRSKEIAFKLLTNHNRPHDSYVYMDDMSGAKMAWLYFHDGLPIPLAIEHISDRDLWQFKMPNTREFMTGLQQHPLEIEAWKKLPLDTNEFVQRMLDDAPALRQQFDTFRDTIVRQTLRTIDLAGYTVPLINVPKIYASEALDHLAKENPFAVGYYDTEYERIFSLRSDKKYGVNVREVAERYDTGGGHDHASGFRVNRNHPLALI